MNQTEIEFTKNWWRSVLDSPTKLTGLLQKWEYTYRDAYDTWNRWIRFYVNTTAGRQYRDPFTAMRTRDMNAADDYYLLFNKYGLGRKSRSTAPFSSYMAEMKTAPMTAQEAIAAVLLLKTTVMERQEVLLSMPETPAEVYQIFEKHSEGLKQTLAYCKHNTTREALDRVFPYHSKHIDQFFKRDVGTMEVVKPEIAVPVQEVVRQPDPLSTSSAQSITQREVRINTSSGDSGTYRVDLNPYGFKVVLTNDIS